MLAEKGMEFIPLANETIQSPSDELAHSDWLGASQIQDSQATCGALADQPWDWVVADHYALDHRWESAIRACGPRLMVIDDLADRQHDCDVLLDANFYSNMATRYDGKVPVHCQLLLGPDYALLRSEFKTLRAQIAQRSGEVKKILVFFGGVDADNHTGLAIEALASLHLVAQVDVVIGAQHPYRDTVQQACHEHGFVCHLQTPDIAALMASADLAIGAGGTAVWERCVLGLPTISFCLAANQGQQVADAAESGLLYAPACVQSIAHTIAQHTRLLMENPALLKLISTKAMQAVDGQGSSRVIAAMAPDGMDIRQANQSDSQQLFEWRNHPTIRAVSRQQAPIAWAEHVLWFDSVMQDNSRVLLIGSVANEPVGVVRFDTAGDLAEVSIYLVPNGKHLGQGRHLLAWAEQWLKKHRPDVQHIRASVLAKNRASSQFFIRSNYKPQTIFYQKDL
jgi:UDP-2,4-diacetamido-2,4,6-trideoxy-beta-L-altropyranose hydrolase